MSHEPKLEIYKLKLFKKKDGTKSTFRDMFRLKFKGYPDLQKPITEAAIFLKYFQDFITSIDNSNGFKTDPKKKKGFTIAFDEDINGVRTSHINDPLRDNMLICGLLDGGKHSIKRWLNEVNDISKKSDITTKNIVCDRFFFLLYTPLDSPTGILMIQGYSEIKISDIFRKHVVDYFKENKEIESEIELFIPKSLKDKYLNSAIFKSAKFSTDWQISPDFHGSIKEKDYEIEVRIEIIDKSAKKSSYKYFKDLVSLFGQSVFKPNGGTEKNLLQFSSKNAKMTGNGLDFPIDFDNEENIKPTILLRDVGVDILEGELPNFKQIEDYSRNLLSEITLEIMPQHAVENI